MVLLICGFRYWSLVQTWNPFWCVYNDPACSAAVATWVLVLASSAAFVAAVKAAIDAAGRLRLERSQVFGQRECHRSHHGAHATGIHLRIFPSEAPDGNALVVSVNRPTLPVRDQPGNYRRSSRSRSGARESAARTSNRPIEETHDFFNLGRSPVIDPSVSMKVSWVWSDTKTRLQTESHDLQLPSIPVNGEVHVRLSFATSMAQPRVTFSHVERLVMAGDEPKTRFCPQGTMIVERTSSGPAITTVAAVFDKNKLRDESREQNLAQTHEADQQGSEDT